MPAAAQIAAPSASAPAEPVFPGDEAGPAALLALAHAYRDAAGRLRPGKGAGPAAGAPWRLMAIQAVELYFNAVLRHAGHAPKDLRALGHDLAGRAALAQAAGLTLRRRTAAHLAAMTENRDYLAARYDPARPPACLHTNRLAATLDEVAEKVTGRLAAA